jgi:biopolymer transport protein ExbD
MAELIVEEKGKKGGKRRPKKHGTHIDMTPMVDLMCLLITFFMLTTAFNKPKVMVITMPEKDKTEDPKDAPKISAERTLNILLTEKDEIFYYMGIADPKKPPLPTLVKTDFSKDGIRKLLLIKNKELFTKIAEYRDKRVTGKIVASDTTADNEIKRLKNEDKHGPIVLIKADAKAKYRDIVNIIDEMAICNVASYAIVDMSPVELGMLADAPK